MSTLSGGLQVRRKNLKKGLQFTIMVVGCSGLGKSTYINTLCGIPVISRNPDTAGLDKTINITPIPVEIEEDGVKISLTIVDTPGFGDGINNEHCFNEVLGYIERQYDEILIEESRIKRNPKFQDNRVHVLLYFIAPTGHALKEMDIQFMQKLGSKVNIIPIIAKADSLSKKELQSFKKRIPVFSFPFDPEEDDEETIHENEELRNLLPFAIIGSEEEVSNNGRKVRGRTYPWGVAEVDNSDHCDFSSLHYVLLSSHLQDLKEITHDSLYEHYRTAKLSNDHQYANV